MRTARKFAIFRILFTRMTLSTLPILTVCWMRDTHEPRNQNSLIHQREHIWLSSGRASEREIWESEVRFLMGTRNFFSLSNARDQTIKQAS